MRTARFRGSGEGYGGGAVWGDIIQVGMVLGGQYSPRGGGWYGRKALPPPVDGQTRVKTLLSRNFVCWR